MGWGRMLLLGNWGQQMDIHDTQRDLRALGHKVSAKRQRLASLDAEVQRLTAELDECKLYIAALSRVLVGRGLMSRDELGALVETVDDGRD